MSGYDRKINTKARLRSNRDRSEVIQDAPEVHDTLNPALWEDLRLKDDVLNQAHEAVNAFYDELADLDITVEELDIVLLGSNTAYNYYEEGSDLDIHIILKGATRERERKLEQALFRTFARNFNQKYKIDFYGIPVELYVELDEFNKDATSAYSLYTGWLIEPKRADAELPEELLFDKEFAVWEQRYKSAINGALSEISALIEDIYDMRKEALENGEYELGNLIFKEFRKLGYLDELKIKQNELKGEELSL